jgi:hypothetical protein
MKMPAHWFGVYAMSNSADKAVIEGRPLAILCPIDG